MKDMILSLEYTMDFRQKVLRVFDNRGMLTERTNLSITEGISDNILNLEQQILELALSK